MNKSQKKKVLELIEGFEDIDQIIKILELLHEIEMAEFEGLAVLIEILKARQNDADKDESWS